MMNFFNSERNVIITAKEKINAVHFEKFLEKNLNKFHFGSRIFIMAGLHHKKEGDEKAQIAESDSGLIQQFMSKMEMIIDKCEQPCEDNCSKCNDCGELHAQKCHNKIMNCPCHHKCNNCPECQELHAEECGNFCLSCTWNVKEIRLGEIVAMFSNKVRRKEKYVLSKTSKNAIKDKFEQLLKTDYPHVFIFASCFSHESEINHLLRSSGMYSCLLMSAERGEITCGKVCHLDKNQQEVLQRIVNDDTIKDVIFDGIYFQIT